jgi:pSer/pThr/pTyr-binding forkhead associated (FHA) protein
MGAALVGVSGRIDLGTTRLSIGRAPNNQLVLTDTQVSGYHAEVLPEGKRYLIVDLGSSNGTFVNGYRLTPNVACILNPNDNLRFGQHFDNPRTTFTYQVGGAVPIEPTAPAPSPSPSHSPSPQRGYHPPPNQVYQSPFQESQVNAQQRPSIREIVSGQANYTPAAGMSEKEMADLLDQLAKLSSGNSYLAMKAGEALGKAMGIKSTKQLHKIFSTPYQYASVVLACVLALRHLQYEIVSLYDTPRGSIIELKMSTDIWSFGGMLTIEFIDEGPSGIVVNGESEIKGQMFDWGKGKRTLEEIFSATERYLKRLTGY